MKRIVYLTLLLATSLCACSPLELSMQLTATQVASEIFGTQTATAPTSTITFTPSLTLTPGPTRTITPPPTLTKRPTATPPPTVTLDADEVERMILCYKAAVVVWADYNAYIQIIDNRHGYSDDLSRDLATLTNERRSRVSAIIVDTKDKYGLPQTIIKVNGTELTRRDCAAVNQNIILANFQIDHLGLGAWEAEWNIIR